MMETLILKSKSKDKHLSISETEAFIKDHEITCNTMDATDFRNLFLKYDLSFTEDYKDVYNSSNDSLEFSI
jgi:hypothetical protein